MAYTAAMRIDVLTLFPGMFTAGPLAESIVGRAVENGIVDLRVHDLRAFGLSKYKQVDDKPYGGGAGMLLRADVVVPAIEAISTKDEGRSHKDEAISMQPKRPHRIYLSARGEPLTQSKVETLAAKHDWLLLLCGHYEGVDQRVMEGGWIDEEIRIGDYVLTGGELPAMVLIDAVSRHLPGVLGKEESAGEESFSPALDRKREYPHYTRPEEFRGLKVPDVLISGHHAEIEKWRKGGIKD